MKKLGDHEYSINAQGELSIRNPVVITDAAKKSNEQIDFDKFINQKHIVINQKHIVINQKHIVINQKHIVINQKHIVINQKHIVFREIFLDVDAVKRIAEFLKHNHSCTDLILIDTKMTDEGVKHLSDALKHNTCLRFINLARNPDITDIGAGYILDALKNNTHHSIRAVDLPRTSVTKQLKDEICGAILNNTCRSCTQPVYEDTKPSTQHNSRNKLRHSHKHLAIGSLIGFLSSAAIAAITLTALVLTGVAFPLAIVIPVAVGAVLASTALGTGIGTAVTQSKAKNDTAAVVG